MNKQACLWIDKREAIIVIHADERKKTKRIISNCREYLRYSEGSHSKDPEGLRVVTSEDQGDRKITNNLKSYYDEIITTVRDADTIQIFGLSEAKNELEKRLEHERLKAHITFIEIAD